MKELFMRATRRSYWLGGILCSLHLAVSWWVIVSLCLREPDAQWQLVWIFFLPFDFPFSLLVLFSGNVFPDWTIGVLPYPVSEFRDFLWPAFVHGIVGPAWYFFLPMLASGLWRRWKGK